MGEVEAKTPKAARRDAQKARDFEKKELLFDGSPVDRERRKGFQGGKKKVPALADCIDRRETAVNMSRSAISVKRSVKMKRKNSTNNRGIGPADFRAGEMEQPQERARPTRKGANVG